MKCRRATPFRQIGKRAVINVRSRAEFIHIIHVGHNSSALIESLRPGAYCSGDEVNSRTPAALSLGALAHCSPFPSRAAPASLPLGTNTFYFHTHTHGRLLLLLETYTEVPVYTNSGYTHSARGKEGKKIKHK